MHDTYVMRSEQYLLELSLQIPSDVWEERINKRNASDEAAYYVDEGLLEKVKSIFEEPSKEEIDVLVES